MRPDRRRRSNECRLRGPTSGSGNHGPTYDSRRRAHPALSIDRESGDDADEEGLVVVDRSMVDVPPAEVRVLEAVLGIDDRARHPIRDAEQPIAVALESVVSRRMPGRVGHAHGRVASAGVRRPADCAAAARPATRPLESDAPPRRSCGPTQSPATKRPGRSSTRARHPALHAPTGLRAIERDDTPRGPPAAPPRAPASPAGSRRRSIRGRPR